MFKVGDKVQYKPTHVEFPHNAARIAKISYVYATYTGNRYHIMYPEESVEQSKKWVYNEEELYFVPPEVNDVLKGML